MPNSFLVLTVAFVMQLLLYFTRGEKGDDIGVITTGCVFGFFALFKIVVFKRDNPGKPLSITQLFGLDEIVNKTQQKVAETANKNKKTEKKETTKDVANID